MAIACAALVACGSTKDKSYQGPVVGTLQGQLTSPPNVGGLTAGQPLRLAVSWILQRTAGVAILDTEVEDQPFQPKFPSNFTFNLHHAPPPTALINTPAGVRVAIGLLLAYEDLNGNGKLDRIPATGTPVDHVVAASVALSNDPGRESGIVYAEADIPSLGLKKGFQYATQLALIGNEDGTFELEGATVIDSVTLEVDGSVRNNLWNCDIPQATFGAEAHCFCTSPDLVIVEGNFNASHDDFSGGGYVAVADCSGERSDAVVTLNGHLEAFVSTSHDFEFGENDAQLGMNALHVAVPGRPAVDLSATAYVLEMQAPTGVVRAGHPLNLSWTSDAPPGTTFHVNVTDTTGDSWLGSTTALSLVDPAAPAGDVSAFVTFEAEFATPEGAAHVTTFSDSDVQFTVPAH